MKKAGLFLLVGGLAGGALGMWAAAESPASKSGNNISQKMRGLQGTVKQLLLDLADERKFSDNAKRVEKAALDISKLAHGVENLKPEEKSDLDPSISMIAGELSKEAERAYAELRRGNKSYARSLLRSVTSYCVACHSRTQLGPSFSGDAGELKGLSKFQRAEFLAATRQFEAAFNEFESIVAEPSEAAARPLEWERAVRHALTLAVRVLRRDAKDPNSVGHPDKANRIVERVLATPTLPAFLKVNAEAWQKSIAAWKSEGARMTTTEEGLFMEATRLFSLAKTAQRYPADRSADVAFLRASAGFHAYLSRFPDGAHAGEALLSLGTCYDVLQGLGIWDLQELYFVACIKKVPHSDVAKRCYSQYEESVYLGYTGSSGTELPRDVKARLGELEKLAR